MKLKVKDAFLILLFIIKLMLSLSFRIVDSVVYSFSAAPAVVSKYLSSFFLFCRVISEILTVKRVA